MGAQSELDSGSRAHHTMPSCIAQLVWWAQRRGQAPPAASNVSDHSGQRGAEGVQVRRTADLPFNLEATCAVSAFLNSKSFASLIFFSTSAFKAFKRFMVPSSTVRFLSV